MKRSRNAKILATLGPASSSPEMIEALFKAGADAFRLNFSHGTHAEQQQRYDIIRQVEKTQGRPIGIVADLQGPKLRVGNFTAGKVHLPSGQHFRLDLDDALGDEHRVSLPHPEVFAALRAGTELLLDDGRMRLRVEQHGADFAETVVITGGDLSNHKGVNVPNVVLPLSPLTDKDKVDLAYALEMGVDWLALSFVQRPEDVQEIKRLVGDRVRIISKLEKPAAIDHLAAIIELSDGIMVARGDLGVECPPETVPILQKRIIRAAREAGKPVVVATQMLDSMIHAPAPTRAEASDVATAVYDGADAVMLSAETAAGDYPLDAVTIMDRIIDRVEGDEQYKIIRDASRPTPTGTTRDAISAAARQVAHTLAVGAVVTYTSSGSTTLRAARERPDVPILCLTTNVTVARQMAIVWGSYGVVAPDIHSFGEMVALAIRVAQEQDFAQWKEQIVITAGVPFGTPGTTNILRVAVVEEQ
ncbi:pyruvate kinase [Telmatospirillum siberiense]|uniref:Pyruvate kinase n=1 Tax=Telmatospirillum siberiense TaxID=382514 RepID=A0A2N3Q0Z3_9PROT|nr:pyruvate kinase [Telmatospirillum siberiense]PKU26312.1 pyruvate kinase [Telmatospirillum siberiense]